jgi:uncharacterized protein (TIGR03435 family)
MYRSVVRNHIFRACCAHGAISVAPVGTALRASPQAVSDELSFRVATVKPVDPSYHFDGKHFWAHVNPAGASYWYMTVANLITYAYNIRPFQVTGPEWTTDDHFDIEARFPDRADVKEDRSMLQVLLKDRFKLAFHIEKRELEGYVLVAGKHGAKLKPSLIDPAVPDAPLQAGDGNAGVGQATINADGSSTVNMGRRGTQTIRLDREHSAIHYEESNMTMRELAGRLSGCLGDGGHKVIDLTGIKGSYQLTYDCPMPGPQRPEGADAAGTLPSDPQGSYLLIQSLDALGLKLEKRKMPMDVYVVDHVERPSGN